MLASRTFVFALLSAAACAHLPAIAAVSPAITTAVADPARPAADKERDARRKPAELLAFAGIKPGSKVADLFPGGGYFTRIFSTVVGPSGHVYALSPREDATLKAFAATRPNITYSVEPLDKVQLAEPLDFFWTSLNYHDVLNRNGTVALNALVFRSLKPGGVYIVIDHSAANDAPADVSSTLHRIRRDTVTEQVKAAGFELVEDSALLANPDDPRTAGVRDPSVQGRTDQFVLKFRKPG